MILYLSFIITYLKIEWTIENVYCAEFAHNIVCLLHHYVQNCTNMCRQLLSMQNLHCLHIFGTLDKGCRNLPSLDTRPPNNGLDEYAEFCTQKISPPPLFVTPKLCLCNIWIETIIIFPIQTHITDCCTGWVETL